jgi:hypothetical protein
MLPFMKPYTLPLRFLFISYLAVQVISGPIAAAQDRSRELDDLAKRVGKQVAKAGIGSIVVADLYTNGGSNQR